MNNIIVGIDFSKGSLCALGLAIDIANKWDSNVIMLWVNTGRNKNEEEINASKEKLNSLVTLYRDKLKKDHELIPKIRSGRVHQEIAEEAKESKALMLIVGTHGASGYEKRWIGSNAVRTITLVNVPVISIRDGFNFDKKLEHIVLPIDSSNDTRQKVPFTAEMAKIFGAKICILGLYSSKIQSMRNSVDIYVGQIEKFLGEEHIPYSVDFIEAENLTTETLKYATEINADLIAIMSEQEKTLTNFFMGSFAQQMVHSSPIPVLTIHPEDLYNIAK